MCFTECALQFTKYRYGIVRYFVTGKENLKSQLSKGEKTTNRVSSRSSNMQGAIKDALKGKNDERSDKQRDADNTVKKDPLQYRGFYENQGSKL